MLNNWVALENIDISTVTSPEYEFTLGLELNQFKRSYADGYTFNIFEGFNGVVDTATKNFTNFYLSDNQKFNNFINSSPTRIESGKILTTLKLGGEYLTFEDIDPTPYKYLKTYEESLNYGIASFNITGDQFNVEFFDNNRCHIFYEKNEIKYYLVGDIDNDVSFVKFSLLDFSEDSTQPQDFTYIYSDKQRFIIFLKDTASGTFYIKRDGNELALVEVDDKLALLFNAFEIEKGINTLFDKDFNTSFITYDEVNNINDDKSVRGLKNNILFHKKYHKDGHYLDAIVLKNQLSQNDVFTTNSLLSGVKILLIDNRIYSSISETIKQEKTEDLILNYTFNNKDYLIKSGKNDFTLPDNMYPFSTISIHDTKFKESGAFAAYSPEFADKVYELSEYKSKQNNNQTLLCTWLSGNEIDSIWVDRYYYPDLTTKEASLTGQAIFQSTYDQYIENLIKNNSTLKENVSIKKFFDKKSDMIFSPSKKYTYHRISAGESYPTFKYCEEFGEKYSNNYHTKINDSGMFNFSFYFSGDSLNWQVFSKRNTIDSGIQITKSGNILSMRYKIYNPSSESFITINEIQNIFPNQENFIGISVDSLNGVGYFILNNNIYNFELPLAQFYKKKLLYGDLFFSDGIDTQNILNLNTTVVNNVIISDNFIPSNTIKLKPITDGKVKINDIYITLPCGSRNGEDNIEQLAITNSNSFKSTNINLHIKNMDIDNDQILENLNKEIENRYSDFYPINTKVVNIKRRSYK
jgi:hypothetical protein